MQTGNNNGGSNNAFYYPFSPTGILGFHNQHQ